MATEVPIFLTLDEALALHSHQLQLYGGLRGVRDVGALKSALAMPAATFDGNLLHATVSEQAAAYLFHVANNRPFIDGNKRTGLACALAFLRLNGWRVRAGEDEMVDFVLDVAKGVASKSQVAVWLQQHSVESA